MHNYMNYYNTESLRMKLYNIFVVQKSLVIGYKIILTSKIFFWHYTNVIVRNVVEHNFQRYILVHLSSDM